jgi:hypothetical protein
MGHTGDKFTWHRGEVRERLDRVVCNSDWNALFPLASVSNEPHSVLIIVRCLWISSILIHI